MSQPGPIDWRSLDEPPLPPQPPRTAARDPRVLLAAGAAVLGLIAVAGFLVLAAPRAELVVDVAQSVSPAASDAPATRGDVWVDVSGAVRRPGLYRLADGSRVGDAIRTAGGFAPTVDARAAEQSLNLAARVEDGTEVHVPALGDGTPSPVATAGAEPGTPGAVDLNTATASELEALPAIGEVTAARIIESREQQPFASVDELLTREIVGEAAFEKIRDLVRAGP